MIEIYKFFIFPLSISFSRQVRDVLKDSSFFNQGLKSVKDSCLEKFPHIPACCELSVKVLTFMVHLTL